VQDLPQDAGVLLILRGANVRRRPSSSSLQLSTSAVVMFLSGTVTHACSIHPLRSSTGRSPNRLLIVCHSRVHTHTHKKIR
jgi:hypothetical protein